MTYQEQLQEDEWKEKRKIILKRDGCKCSNCNIARSEIISIVGKRELKSSQVLIDEGFSIVLSADEKSVSLLNGVLKEEVAILRAKDRVDKMRLKFGYRYGEKIPWTYNMPVRFAVPSDWDLSEEQDLNIHHKYYIKGNSAWEYKDDALISLCAECHKKEHAENEIFIYSQNGESLRKIETCDRCEGQGIIEKYSYYQGGVCFKCHGSGDNISETMEF